MKKDVLEAMKRERGYLHESHEFLLANDPDFLELYDALYKHLLVKEKLIPIKVREFVVVSILCAKGEYQAAEVHIRRAIEHGATPKEITEILETAMLYSGAPTLIYGIEALINHLRKTGKVELQSKKIIS